jgi:hypothetical protein
MSLISFRLLLHQTVVLRTAVVSKANIRGNEIKSKALIFNIFVSGILFEHKLPYHSQSFLC